MIPEYRVLYGDRASTEYECTVELQLNASIAHPSVIALGAYIDRRVVGIAVGRNTGDIGQIAFVHLLDQDNDESTPSRLMIEIVHALRDRGVTGVIADFIPLCTLRVDTALMEEGFRTVDRMLMTCDLKPSLRRQSWPETSAYSEADWPECASLLHESFISKAEPLLYNELHSIDQTRLTLRQYRQADNGDIQPQWAREIKSHDELQGLALGTLISADVGFIFQVAVKPCCQGRGLGSKLVDTLLSEFEKSGMQEVQLGVTVDDRAYGFYAGLGFEDKRSVRVYFWEA